MYLLIDEGKPCDTYKNKLFHIRDICQMICGSTTQVTITVINKENNAFGYASEQCYHFFISSNDVGNKSRSFLFLLFTTHRR